jgi:hypothetical protein
MKDTSQMMYPLGRNVFASVTTWRGQTKIHIRNYVNKIDRKRACLVPKQKGVTMDVT